MCVRQGESEGGRLCQGPGCGTKMAQKIGATNHFTNLL